MSKEDPTKLRLLLERLLDHIDAHVREHYVPRAEIRRLRKSADQDVAADPALRFPEEIEKLFDTDGNYRPPGYPYRPEHTQAAPEAIVDETIPIAGVRPPDVEETGGHPPGTFDADELDRVAAELDSEETGQHPLETDSEKTGVQAFDPLDPEAVCSAIIDLGARISVLESRPNIRMPRRFTERLEDFEGRIVALEGFQVRNEGRLRMVERDVAALRGLRAGERLTKLDEKIEAVSRHVERLGQRTKPEGLLETAADEVRQATAPSPFLDNQATRDQVLHKLASFLIQRHRPRSVDADPETR